jgi:hypothetical protein
MVEAKMLIRKGEIGTPGKIRTYDLLLRRQEHLRYVVDATGAIERSRESKTACAALFDAPFDALFSSCRMRNVDVIFLAAPRG